MTKYNVPFDLFGFRILEWRKSIPALFLLLALLSLFSKPSVYNVIIIIALLSWADIARLIRAETLTIKNHLFVQSAITMGFSHVYIIVHHIFPMLKGSLMVIAMYIMAGAVLMEATLSFLGLGLPVEEVSWGKITGGIQKCQGVVDGCFSGRMSHNATIISSFKDKKDFRFILMTT
ncbi:MAG: ABC transporter permease subunit [Saprospiraceae bacterium]|nr:ABC transporter permease subunit [Saprospiraceae bacterium]